MRGKIIWFFGRPCSGKTTLADKLINTINARGMKWHRLDGDDVRKKFTRDLGFSVEDRFENIRRMGYLAQILSSHGINVVASFVTPLRAYRIFLELLLGRDLIFIECWATTEGCISRDVKGMYKKALTGEISNFTGLTSPYQDGDEDNRYLRLYTERFNIDGCIGQIKTFLKSCEVF